MKTPVVSLAAFSLLALAAFAQDVAIERPNASAETAEQRDARLRWFREARFGMFIHWGVYAVPAGEFKGQRIPHIGEWIMKNAKIPIAEYKAFAPQFTAAKYDPKAWAALAREAGMKYVVITSKHHDGFALYDSAVSDWNSAKASGARRDLLQPLAEATRAEGLKFGLYYSQAQDWVHPGGSINGLKERDPGWDEAHRGSFDDYLRTIALPQVREILGRYQPDILWWDTPVWMNTERAKPLADAVASLAPKIITNNRLGGSYPGDTKTPEQHIPPRGFPGEMFEVCMTMNDTWGFKSYDTNWKSVRQILRNLSDIASKGGNFLLNVGPTAEGEIPAASIERLKAVGRWMSVNAEAIHGTDASPFPRRLPWGRTTRKTGTDGGITLYLHVWDWPADGKLLLPTLQNKPASAKLLASAAPVTAQTSPEGLIVQLPNAATDPEISVVALRFDGPLAITQEPFSSPGADGAIRISPRDADPHGGLSGNLELVGHGNDAHLAGWRDGGWTVEYAVKVPAASRWNVSAEIAAEHPVKLGVALAAKNAAAPKPADVPATGGATAWKPVNLGAIDLPAGESSFKLVPVKDGWKTIHLRHVTLTPAQP
jgi:alpha-L-fucosidase